MEKKFRPTVISTFAGCGGSSLGYKMAGFKELLAIEWENNAVETFNLNFPDVPIWQRDIRKVSGKEILEFTGLKKGELDVFDGSPPCQGFSTVGQRNFSDKRNDLYLDFIRLVNDLQPKVFVMENVSGLVKGKMKKKFQEIMIALKETGYNVKCKLMNSMYYNVPQSRQRLIWIGVRDGEPKFPEPNNNIITSKRAIGYLEKTENRKYITPGMEYYASKLKQGENASKYHPKGSFFGLMRIHENKPCPTVIKSADTGLLHYKYNMYFLSVKEIQVLSSFPESFNFIGSRSIKIDRIGNSVMPKFMKEIALTIKNNIL